MNTIRDPNHIRSGQVLAVPGTQAARPQSSPAPAAKPPYVTTAAPPASAPAQSTITAKVQPEEAYFYYDVVEGDTMASVASMFFTTVAEVGNLNGINANSVLRAGQQLVVPTRLYFEEKKRREAKGIASASTKTAG
jgi:LysM repeat protein